MSTSDQAQISKKKPEPIKTLPQAKAASKPQTTGLSREELRRIVLEMIG